MDWLQDNAGKLVVAAAALIVSLVGFSWWVTAPTSDPASTGTSAAGTATTETREAPQPGVPSRDPRTGELPPEFLVEFVDKLTQTNKYVRAKNLGAGDVRYRQLWEWAELGGLKLQALNRNGELLTSDARRAVAAPLIDIVTLEGDRFCAVAADIIDPSRVADGSQVLVASACQDLFEG